MRQQKKKSILSLRNLSVFLLFFLVICFTSVLSLAADDIEVRIIDNEKTVSVTVSRISEKAILKKATDNGISSLNEYDVGVLDENNNIYNIYRAVDVSVSDNEQNYSFKMSSYNLSKDTIINECISRYSISPIDRNDIVKFDKTNNKVSITRSFVFRFNYNDVTEQSIAYYGETVEEFLKRREISLSESDNLSLSMETTLTGEAILTLERRTKITVKADGEEKEHIVSTSTVEDVLKKLHISLSEDDLINQELSDTVTEGMVIEINRVVYKEVTEEEVIDYEIINKNDDTLSVGQTSVEQYGVEGLKEITKKQKFIDGELVDEEVLSEKTIKEPTDKIVIIGTKPIPQNKPITTTYESGTLIDYNGNVVSYSYYHTGKCAAYTGGTHTSIGLPVQKGNVAVDPGLIPYGTRLYIASADGSFVYGYAIAADTGGAVMSGNYLVDCYYDTYAECATLGIRKLNVYVLD